jgi:hypothetical protein
MSSIYRKGRDGYYYYQTYVYNTDTGKNDKRIFHSLATKDKAEAEKLQSELDLQHVHQKTPPQKEKSLSSLFLNWKILAFVLAIVIVIIFYIDIFQSDSVKPIKREAIVKEPVLKEDDIPKIIEKYDVINTTLKPEQTTTQMDTVPLLSMLDIIKKPVKPKPTIPEHTIIRIERLSSSFKQGKVYVTVDQNASIESMRMLCAKIKKDYKEFSNIIICLYADSPSGNALASGAKYKLGTKEQSKAWLAMYSYNTVEGEYFDDHPGGYLGTY